MGDVVGLVVNLRTVDSDYDPGHGSRGTIRAHPHYARGTRGGHSGREGAVSEGGRGVNNMRFMVNLPWGRNFGYLQSHLGLIIAGIGASTGFGRIFTPLIKKSLLHTTTTPQQT